MADDGTTADPVAARLGYLRATLDAAIVQPEAFDLPVLLGDWGKALDALAELLKRHHRSAFPATMGADRGKHYCLSCTSDVDHHTLYALWPCDVYATIAREVAEDEPQPQRKIAEPGGAEPARVQVFPPGCGLPGCMHHYAPGRNMTREGCKCPSWFDGGGWHLVSVNPECTAHDVQPAEVITDGS